MFGAGGGTSSYREAEDTDLIVLWGSNARETHPIFFHHLLKAVRKGARLYAIDPRRTSSAEWADGWLGLDVGSDIALANAMAREIIAAGLEDRAFIERATDDFEAYKAKVESYTLEYAEQETGVPAESIRELAHAFAKAPRAMICWTLGITEHHNAVDNVLALISLVLLTGHVGPLRQRREPAPWPEQRPGRRRHGRPARPAARLPARRERRAAGQVRCRVGRGRPAAAGLAPVGDVRRHGGGRPHGGLLHRREPGPVGGRPEARDPPPEGTRDAGGPGPVPDQDRGARRRRPAGHRGLGRERRDRHQLRAAGPARAGGRGAAARRPRRPRDHLRPGQPDGRRLGRRRRRDGLGRGPAPLAGPRRDELRDGSRSSAGSSGRATTRTTRASCSCTRGCGRTRCPGNRVPFVPGRPRPAGRQARRRVPDPADHRATAGLVQHGRPDGRLHLTAAPRRDRWTSRPEDAVTLRAGRRRGGPRRLAAWPGRGAGADRRIAAAGPDVHDACTSRTTSRRTC